MIQIKKRNENSYYLEYKDSLKAKYKLLRVLASFNCKRIDENNWIVPKESIERITDFDIELISMPWENIGQGLKYEPYEYQKETVLFGCNQDNALFCLPCGSGKKIFSFIKQLY